MGFLSDTIMATLKLVQVDYEPVFVDASYYAGPCGCSGHCGQSYSWFSEK